MIETKQDGARMLLVGYDKDVAVMTKEGKPLLDKKGNQVYDESKRITGLIPYLQRTAELHRPETPAIIGKIFAPMPIICS